MEVHLTFLTIFTGKQVAPKRLLLLRVHRIPLLRREGHRSEVIYTWNPAADYLCRKLPTRLFRPSTKSFGRLELAATLLLRCRTNTAGCPESLFMSLPRRGRWGTISYSPRLSRTDWDRAIPSLARRSRSMVNPGSPFPLRSSGWYFCSSHQHSASQRSMTQFSTAQRSVTVGRAGPKKKTRQDSPHRAIACRRHLRREGL